MSHFRMASTDTARPDRKVDDYVVGEVDGVLCSVPFMYPLMAGGHNTVFDFWFQFSVRLR